MILSLDEEPRSGGEAPLAGVTRGMPIGSLRSLIAPGQNLIC
jgi:hypothetical protein